jgi:putative ABC transport system ATP-binding protein
MIEAKRLSKQFVFGKTRVDALRGVDLAVGPGEFVAVVGASGSGKSTLLSLLAGLDRPTEGEVLLDGERLDKMSEDGLARLRREKIGFVFQAFHLVPSLTVTENVALPAALGAGSFSDARARELLDRVGLGARAGFFPGQLSGGEKQRAAIARALMNDPVAVFADEPTGNLDSANGRAVLELLDAQTRRAGKTLILVTHDAEVASRADRRITLADGRIAP